MRFRQLSFPIEINKQHVLQSNLSSSLTLLHIFKILGLIKFQLEYSRREYRSVCNLTDKNDEVNYTARHYGEQHGPDVEIFKWRGTLDRGEQIYSIIIYYSTLIRLINHRLFFSKRKFLIYKILANFTDENSFLDAFFQTNSRCMIRRIALYAIRFSASKGKNGKDFSVFFQ